jgi:cation diffusion facilitator family transporter
VLAKRDGCGRCRRWRRGTHVRVGSIKIAGVASTAAGPKEAGGGAGSAPAGSAGAPTGAVGRAQLAAVAAAGSLVVLKGVAAWLTSSLALGAAALDSAVDVFVSSASYFVVRRSAAPPDDDHAYGHGRFETLAALGQGLLLLAAAVGLIVAGAQRLVSHQVPQSIELGIAVLAAAMVSSWLASRLLARAAAGTGSPALRADSIHYRADLWVNAGALLALLIVRWARWPAADPLLAIAVSIVVLRAGGRLVIDSVGDLSDRGLPHQELRRIEAIVASFAPEVIGLHDLRTRRSGSRRLIELHLEIPRAVTFEEAHARGARIRRAIESELPRSRVLVHTDPV